METLLIVLGAIALAAIGLLVAALVDTKGDLRNAERDYRHTADYYKKAYYEVAEEKYQANLNRDELRKVLASAILADKNYLAVDPDTFEALPEDFVISKTTDVGASGDNTILVYQVSPREVGGVKLQNEFL